MPALGLYEDATLTVLRRDNLLIVAWRDAATAAQIAIVGKHVAAYRELYGDRVGFVNVIVSGSLDRFSHEARRAANELTARHPRTLCSAHVVLVEGLTGVLTRAVMRAMALVGRHEGPWRVFDNVEPAAEWIAERLAGSGDPARACTPADVIAVLREASRRAPRIAT